MKYIQYYQIKYGYFVIYVMVVKPLDVNGYLKRPNKWGHDLFTFQLMEDGRLLPMGANGTTYTDDNRYCSISSTNSQNGISCTDNALNEKDYFKNLP